MHIFAVSFKLVLLNVARDSSRSFKVIKTLFMATQNMSVFANVCVLLHTSLLCYDSMVCKSSVPGLWWFIPLVIK